VPTVPAVPTQDGRPATDASTKAITPVEIRVPRLAVTSTVVPIGVERNGELEIPEDVRTVGWYRYGPRPGDRNGSVVMSGHVDSAEQGKGSFFELGRLRPGDTVFVRTADRRTWRYRVVAREEWPKTAVPLDRIFARDGAPRLTLVTCGGGFREDVRSYQDNIAITAVPEGPM
jgi:sortase (surface protein transpeptidase)